MSTQKDVDDARRFGLSSEEIEALQDESTAAPAVQRRESDATPNLGDDAPAEVASVYRAPPVEDYEGRVAALDSQSDALADRWKSGEITFDEFRAEERQIEADRRALDSAQLKAEISTEYHEQAAGASWKRECDRFLAHAAKADGVDYRSNRVLWTALDAGVKELAGDPANIDKPSRWFLEQAHRNITATIRRLGGDDPAYDAAPAAGGASFSAVDGLDGLEQEAALARMTPEEADRYLSGKAR
jgi:hypothetical protein